MPKLITASCFLLFWVFYEMSGGADFAPHERTVTSQAPFAKLTDQQTAALRPIDGPVVSNAAFNTVETQTLPAVATTTVQIAEPAVIEQMAAPVKVPAEIEEPVFATVYVAGTRVNLREGPGTNHPVLDTLAQGTSADLVATNDDGWAQIRLKDTGQIGWMAARLLSDS